MSGSNAICVVTALLELGMAPMQEPKTTALLDTPAGLVTARAACKDGRCIGVSLDRVPALVERLDFEVVTTEVGRIRADTAFGGVYYALFDVNRSILHRKTHDNWPNPASSVKDAINRQVQHPLYEQINDVACVMFHNRASDKLYRTCTTLPLGRVDRSPWGTSSSVNLATLAARGRVNPGSRLTSRSTCATHQRRTGHHSAQPDYAGHAIRN